MVVEPSIAQRPASKWVPLSALLALALLLSTWAAGSPGGCPGSSFEGEWVLVGATTFTGGNGQVVVATGTGFYVFRQYTEGDRLDWARFEVSPDGTLLESSHPVIPRPPVDLKTGTAAAWDGTRYIYFLAGGDYKDDVRRYVLRYDTLGNSWSQMPETPVAQGAGDALAYVEVQGKPFLYAVVGVAADEVQSQSGERHKQRATQSVLIRYPLAEGLSGRWTILYNFGSTCVDDGSSLVWVGEYLYFLQGCNWRDQPVKYFNRWWLRDTTESWTWLNSVPAEKGANDGASLVWDGWRYIYATVGGCCEKSPPATGKEFFRYDLVCGTWERLPPLPVAIGDYPGNRLAIIGSYLFLWHGSEGGREIYMLRLEEPCSGCGR
jgi:hypothetical protein